MKFLNILTFVIAFVLTSSTVTFAQSANDKSIVVEGMKTITTKVKGITCSSDLKTISANVEKLKGVKTCKAEKASATTKFKIVYDPALVTEKEINAAIQNTGGCKNPNDRPYKVKK